MHFKQGMTMSVHWDDKQRYLNETEGFEEEYNPEWDDELDNSKSKHEKRYHIRKILEERMERKKLRYELDDYEEEIDKDFDWN